MIKIILLSLLLAFTIGFVQNKVTHYNISNNTSNTPIENKQDSSVVIKNNNKDWLSTEKSVERSFRAANWALTAITVVLALIGVSSFVNDIRNRKNDLFSEKFKEDIKNEEKKREKQELEFKEQREKQELEFKEQMNYIEKLKSSLNQKMEFNFTAAEASFRAMDYLSSIVINRNPKLDPKKEFLKKLDETRSILFLYHEDKGARKRALKHLQYVGSTNSLDILDKYRKEINDTELEQLAKKANDAILKKEGVREAREKEEREKNKSNK